MKRIFSILLAVLLIFSILPTTVFAVEDTRTEIATVVGTSNMVIPTFGGTVVTNYDFTFTEGTICRVPAAMGNWFKKDGDNWVRYDGTYFSEGTYYYSNQLRIDSPLGSSYKFAETVDITIDGKKWTHNPMSNYSTYCYGYMNSPEYTVEWQKLPLSFADSYKYDIGKNYTDKAITSYSVADGVFGGVGPYTFSKVSGPEWIVVSADGTVSGTPAAAGENADLVIRVTDSEDNYKEITVSVAKTNINPELREEIDTVVATSNMGTPKYGDAVKTAYDFTFTEGTMCNVPVSMGNWFKKDGDVWNKYTSTTFVEGTYYYSNQLRIDSPYGETYKFAETIDITIDGKKWTHNPMSNYDSYCYGYMNSPEFVIELPPTPQLLFIDDPAYDIPEGYANNAMETISVAPAVSGGAEPYTYSIVSGPSWLSIDNDGTLSGTPTGASGATTAVLKVTDAEGTYKTITINVGTVYKDPATRTLVSAVVANSNIGTPEVGGQVKKAAFTVTDGENARFGGESLCGWYVDDGESRIKYEQETFAEGIYYYVSTIYIDGEAGHSFMFDEAVTVTVDGTPWTVEDVVVENDLSCVTVVCEFNIHDCFKNLVPQDDGEHTDTTLRNGMKAHYFCDICDIYFTEEKVETTKDALTIEVAHSYKTTTTKATTTENGSIAEKCEVCGKIESTKTISCAKHIELSGSAFEYSGKVITPDVVVKDSDGKILQDNIDYTVSYAKGRKNIGKYAVTVTLKGNYSGSKTLYFTINPKGTSLKKVTPGKKTFTAIWKKQTKQTNGYQIQYSTSKSFKKGNKTTTIKKNKTTKVTIKKLTAKKKYYVRIRTYKSVGKTKYYSSWSKLKKVTTKK